MSGRRLSATVLGLVAGAAGFCILMLAGWLVYSRLLDSSTPGLVIVGVLFGAAGLYAGWILGMLVFSAIRGPEDDDEAAA
jgi:hypothetical protein